MNGYGRATTNEIAVQKIEFGKSYPASTFWRAVDDHPSVFNQVTGQASDPKIRPAETAALVEKPVRVESVTDNSNLLMLSGLLLGVASIAVAARLWLRRS